MNALNETGQQLLHQPLTWLLLTLLVFKGCQQLQQRFASQHWLNPTACSIALLIALLTVTGIDYDLYFSGTHWLHELLGPATVALALPLYRNFAKLRSAWWPLCLTLLGGSLVAVFSGLSLGWLLQLPEPILLALAPRSVTTPIAMSLAQQMGGSAALAAVFVLFSGVLGSLLVLPLLKRFGLQHPVVLGYSTGLAAHGLGTARIYAVSGLAGAFSALSMGLNGAFTAVWLPLCWNYLNR